MALETGTYISDLVAANPAGGDALAFADDHMRLVKATLKNTFPNITGAITVTQADLNTKVPNAVQKDGSIAMTGPLSLPAAPTSDLHAATKAYVDAAITAARQNAYPVGSIYTNANNAANPSTLLGFGTWVSFGAGRVPVGVDGGDILFNTPEKTGGSKDAIVVSHNHTATSTVTDPGHKHSGLTWGGDPGMEPGPYPSRSDTGTGFATTGISVSTTVNTTGSSGTNANVQPYITVYMWKRTA